MSLVVPQSRENVMSRVKTLADLEGNEQSRNARPLSAAWTSGAVPRDSENPDAEVATRTQVRGTYVAIDGSLREENFEAGNSATSCLRMCCPCFIAPCSPQAKKDYLAKTFTFLVSVIQICVFVAEISIGGFVSPKINPMFGPPSSTLIMMGGMNVVLIKAGEFWRFVTPIFLHAGIIHLAMNLFAQLRFGLFLERQWNLFRFIPVYLLSGIGGCLLSALWNLKNPETVSVGASGAIMGLMGAFVAELVITWTTLDPAYRKQMAIQVGVWLVMIFLFGLGGSSQIDNAGHLGGLGTGLFFGAILFSYRHPSQVGKLAFLFVSFMILSAFFVVAFLKVYGVIR